MSFLFILLFVLFCHSFSYLAELLRVGVNAAGRENSLDIVLAGGGVAPEVRQKISRNVPHSAGCAKGQKSVSTRQQRRVKKGETKRVKSE